jgi:Arc/MetJ-type ribon-helix-helix transcriptional regulator
MTIQITKPEIEALLRQRLQSGEFKDAEDVILQALRALDSAPECTETERAAAVERLKTFGKKHGLSLGGMTIRELRDEARP